MSAAASFELPLELEAREPPEARGLARDEVRMLVAHRGDGRIEHARFRDLVEALDPGDLLVVNTSGTLAAALPAGRGLELHLSTWLDGDEWAVELRRGSEPSRAALVGETLELPAGGSARVAGPYLGSTRLWRAELTLPGPLVPYLARHGRPIRYGYVDRDWPLPCYQTVYATEPGSAEMPSAGRPFTPEIVTALVARGIAVAPLLLHTGVSSPERGEPPYPERYRVPPSTARLARATREGGGRVIAVGTTVVRALETAAEGELEGWTELVVTPERGVRAVDGLLTGWHEPDASHLLMLEAIAGRELTERSYAAALERRYLWHEFGDVHLILP
jgi:S-adenosylmethionine:tRNA ribosyltransferase-isomerase